MNERPHSDGEASAEGASENDGDSYTRTLTDLLDEIDRASFRRALASRDRARPIRDDGESGRQ